MKDDIVISRDALDTVLSRLTNCHAVFLELLAYTDLGSPSTTDAFYGACDLLEFIIKNYEETILSSKTVDAYSKVIHIEPRNYSVGEKEHAEQG